MMVVAGNAPENIDLGNVARTSGAVIVIIIYITFSLTYCDIFQSICYVVNKRFFTISVC